MIGAILGDIIGSPYEFDCNNVKTKKFPLFSKKSHFTDDTIMTVAVLEGLRRGFGNEKMTRRELIKSMQRFGRLYPYAGYGSNFTYWIYSDNPRPYNSFGNGAAMRVSPVAWIYDNLDDVLKYAKITAAVSHNHPEGIKGAQAVASAVYLARKGVEKAAIASYISYTFGYDLSKSCDEIRPAYHHVESCQETVPQAIIAFLEGTGFKDVIRTAVSLGGDSDTLTAIAGSIAEAYYGVPKKLQKLAYAMLDDELRAVLT